MAAITPTDGMPVGEDGAGMEEAGGDLKELGRWCCILAAAIVAPTDDRLVFLDGTGVISAGAEMAVGGSRRRCDLTDAVVAPTGKLA